MTDDITNVELNEYEKQNMKKENIRAKNSSKENIVAVPPVLSSKLLDENSATSQRRFDCGKGWLGK